jgi:tetratricopeptide (TPR) repeat protein
MATTTHIERRDRPNPLGERLRELRVSAGMTQTDLAGDRFSKEYVSQIERGKTRPTRDTIEWLAGRLGVDAGFLESGIARETTDRVEAQLARIETLNEAGAFRDAIAQAEDLRTAVLATRSAQFEVRALNAEAWARASVGEIKEAIACLIRAREVAEAPDCSDVDRAEVLFNLGVCRFKLSSIATAVGLLDQALEVADGSSLPADILRSRILNWRAQCRQRQRDYEAAREDVERALELAEAAGNRRLMASAYFQASVIAEREGHWILARKHAEHAKALHTELNNETSVGRLLNNLGGLSHLLGKPDEAIRYLQDAFRVLVDSGTDEEAATAMSSLAQVQLGIGEPAAAEKHARHALELLHDRPDWSGEIGNAQLVLARALMEQGRLAEASVALDEADVTFSDFGSASHRAAVWMAQGDLAARRGDDRQAARLYRRAAEALQDFRF